MESSWDVWETVEGSVEQLRRARRQLEEAARDLNQAKEELRLAREEVGSCHQVGEEDCEMLLALHSISGVLRLLSAKPALDTEDEEPSTLCDQVTPLPGEKQALSREDGQGPPRRPVRRRWRSDLPTEGRVALTRNTSAQQLPSTGSGKEMSQGGESRNSHALPRTLSTSVLRIKQRRSFWEKFVQ